MIKNTIPGWMTDAELSVLETVGRTMDIGRAILEIGSFLGRSAYTFAQATKHWGGLVVCVDPWTGTISDFHGDAVAVLNGDIEYLDHSLSLYHHFLINTRNCDNIFPVRMPSNEFNWLFTPTIRPPGAIFIDGDHSADALWSDLCASVPGGQFGADADTAIYGHDYGNPGLPEVKEVVDRFALSHNLYVTNYPDTSIFRLTRTKPHAE